MKAVLISIRPEWCEKIISGKKTIELRKRCPNIRTPFRCYIYCSMPRTKDQVLEIHGADGKIRKANGKVIGEFICDKTFGYCQAKPIEHTEDIERQSCLTREEVWAYAPKGNPVGWHISNLRVYNEPLELSEFRKPCKNDFFCESCAMYSEFEEQCGNKALEMTRPPQSWCYVAER